MNKDQFYRQLVDFIMEIKEIHGSCAVLDCLDVDDVESFAKFNKIVWNYTKMEENVSGKDFYS